MRGLGSGSITSRLSTSKKSSLSSGSLERHSLLHAVPRWDESESVLTGILCPINMAYWWEDHSLMTNSHALLSVCPAIRGCHLAEQNESRRANGGPRCNTQDMGPVVRKIGSQQPRDFGLHGMCETQKTLSSCLLMVIQSRR